jgi:hypothetical protein
MSLYYKVLTALFRLRGPVEMADRLKKSGVKKVTVSDRGGVSVDEVDDAAKWRELIAARGVVPTVANVHSGLKIEITPPISAAAVRIMAERQEELLDTYVRTGATESREALTDHVAGRDEGWRSDEYNEALEHDKAVRDGEFDKAIDNAAKIAARGWVTAGLTQEDVEFFKKRCPLPKFPYGGESIVDKLEAHMVEQLHFQNEQLALKVEEHENRNGLLKDHLKRALYRVREVVAENKHLQSSLDAAYAEIRRLTSTETLVIENMALKDDLMIAKATIKILTAKGPNK